MSISIRDILTFVLIIIIQLLLDNYVDLGIYVYIAIFPYIILLLPFKYKGVSILFSAFAFGLLIDLLGNGVLGLNAGALTTMALCRRPFLKLVINEQSFNKLDTPSLPLLGASKYAIFLFLSYALFNIAFVILEGMMSYPFINTLLKVLISTLVNVGVIFLMSLLTQNKRN